MVDLDELKRLAEGARADGDWFPSDFGHGYISRQDAAFMSAMSPDTAKKLIAVATVLELVRDCSSQEWQQADGKRMAATDNQGRRFWFINEDVMQAARTALEELK